MTHEFETLPDVLGQIEDQLRARVPAAAASPRSRWWVPRRPAMGLALVAACALALVAVPGNISRQSGVAYGRIPLLEARPQPVPERFRNGLWAKMITGRDGALTEAWAFAAPHGTGYLLHGDGLWCLAVPLPDVGPDRGEYGMNCREDLSFGVATHLGSSFVAAVPQGVTPPEVHHTDGTTTSLRPNAEGIVAVEALEPGATVTFYGTEGRSITSPPAQPEG